MPTTLVVMGVSGSGKTTVATGVAERLGWVFAEGDDFHPPANVDKMRRGVALTDEDREPWLRSLAEWIGEREAAGDDAVLTCSALKRTYRDRLADGHPSVRFVHVATSPEVIRDRLERRRDHFMPAALLGSQLSTLETLHPDEPGWTVSGDGEPADVVSAVIVRLAG